MKKEMLKGSWKDAAEKFENSYALDILGYWYSRHCSGEMIDLQEVLEDVQQECPSILRIQLNPYAAILKTEEGNMRIRYWRKGKLIGHSYLPEITRESTQLFV